MRLYKCFIGVLCILACHIAQAVEVKKLKVNDIEIAYYVRGSGEPLVMVMGFRGTMSGWDPAFLEQLSKHFQLILFDNRGVGLSTDTEANHTTIEQMANDTIGLIKALGYEKVHLLGWSMGSMIAMQMAVVHSEMLKTLILCSPSPAGKYWLQLPSMTSARKSLTSPEVSAVEALSLIYPKTLRGSLAAAQYVLRIEEAIRTESVPNDLFVSDQTLERQLQALLLRSKDDVIFEKLASLNVPTLVAGGLEDALDPAENVRKIACQIPFAWSAYFPDAGHAFLSQEYANFAKLIKTFISSW